MERFRGQNSWKKRIHTSISIDDLEHLDDPFGLICIDESTDSSHLTGRHLSSLAETLLGKCERGVGFYSTSAGKYRSVSAGNTPVQASAEVGRGLGMVLPE